MKVLLLNKYLESSSNYSSAKIETDVMEDVYNLLKVALYRLR